MPRQRRGAQFGVWSLFRELLGWNDDAGPLPTSFVVVGRLLGVALVAFGITFAVVLDNIILGVVSSLIGIGLTIGTFELD